MPYNTKGMTYTHICKFCGVRLEADSKEELKKLRNEHREKKEFQGVELPKQCKGLVRTKAGTLSNPQSAKFINARFS